MSGDRELNGQLTVIPDLKRRSVQGVGWSFLDRTLTKLISLGVFLGITRLLSPSELGLAAMAKVVIALIRPLILYPSGPAIVQRAELDRQHNDSAFWTTTLLGVLASLSVGVLAGPTSYLLGQPRLSPVLGILGVQLLIESLGVVHGSRLERKLDFRSLAVKSMAAEVVGGVAGVAMALEGFGVWSIVGQALARQLTDSAVLWIVEPWRPSLGYSWEHARELLRFGSGVTGSNLVGAARGRIHELLIGGLLGAESLGYYSVAYRIVDELGNLLVGSVGTVAFPTFSRLQGDKDRVNQAYLKAVEYTAALAFPAFTGLGLLAPELVFLGLGSRWGLVGGIVRPLVILGIVAALSRFNYSILSALGKPERNITIGLVDLLAGIAAIIFAVPYGLQAVALGYGVSSLLSLGLGLWMVYRLADLNLRLVFKKTLITLTSALVMATGVTLLRSSPFMFEGLYVDVLVQIAFGFFIYIALVRMLQPRLVGELIALLRLLLPGRAN